MLQSVVGLGLDAHDLVALAEVRRLLLGHTELARQGDDLLLLSYGQVLSLRKCVLADHLEKKKHWN